MNEVKHMKRHQKHQFEIDSDLHFRVVWVLIDVCHFVGQGWRWLKSLSTPKARWRNLPVNPAYLAPAPSTYHGKLRRSICHLKPTEIQRKPTLHRSVPIHAFFCYRELFSHNLSTIHVPSVAWLHVELSWIMAYPCTSVPDFSEPFWIYSLGFSWWLLFDLQWSWRILVYLTLLHQYLLEEYLKIPSR